MLDSISRAVELFSKFAIGFLFGLTVTICLIQVCFRYLLGFPFFWAEEIMRLFFIWFVYLGIALCFQEESHIAISVVTSRFPLRIQKFLEVFNRLLAAIFLIILVILGLKITWFIREQSLPATRMPVYLLYLAFPLGILISLVFVTQSLWKRADK